MVSGAQVVSTDEFWDGDGFELSRLRSEVFEPLLAGSEARYAAWDWVGRRPGGMRVVEPSGVIVVEGHMVERLHFAMAQRTVAIAEQIREMELACA